MPTNVKLTEAPITRVDGYFYTLSNTNDTLFKRVDSGEIAFSYPLSSDLVNSVKCIQYDGRYFYTLENITTGNGQLLFKKWSIDEYTVQLERTYILNGAANQKYDCNSFSIDYYQRSFNSSAISGSSVVTFSGGTDRVSNGDILNLGPSTFSGDEGKIEEVTVLAVSGTNVHLTTPIQYSYNPGNKISFSKRCWFFNKYRPNDSDPTNGSGQLYSFDLNPLVTTVVARKAGNEFRSVLASMFIRDASYPGGAREFLSYMNQTNLLFIEVQDTNLNFLDTIQSAAQNNQETGGAIIPVYAICYENNSIFRIQHKATYRTGGSSTTEDWGTQYNYQVSTLERLPQSISLSASRSVIPADGVSQSVITALVKDQFDRAVSGRQVNFSDNDTSATGQMNPTQANTDSNGQASSVFRAGTAAATVTITADT